MSDQIFLHVNNKKFTNFLSYQVESSMFVTSDPFNIDLAVIDNSIKSGMECRLVVNGQTELRGIIDITDSFSDKNSSSTKLIGRDFMGILNDSHPETFDDFENKTLREITESLLKDVPFIKSSDILFADGGKGGIVQDIESKHNKFKKSFKVSPGQSYFEILSNAALAQGLMFFYLPQGIFVFGQPGSTGAHKYTIDKSNIKSRRKVHNITDQYSRYIYITQSNEDSASGSSIVLKAVVDDSDFPFKKVLVSEDSGAVSDVEKRVELQKQKRKLDAFFLEYVVQNHSFNTNNWQTNTFCYTRDDVFGINKLMTVTGRSFEKNKDDGTITRVKLGTIGKFPL